MPIFASEGAIEEIKPRNNNRFFPLLSSYIHARSFTIMSVAPNQLTAVSRAYRPAILVPDQS